MHVKPFPVSTVYSPHVVMISRQQRRVQLMRIRQKEERRECSRKKRRKQQSQHHTHSGKAMHPEPPYRRKPQPVRRYDGDVLSPVGIKHTHTHTSICFYTFNDII